MGSPFRSPTLLDSDFIQPPASRQVARFPLLGVFQSDLPGGSTLSQRNGLEGKNSLLQPARKSHGECVGKVWEFQGLTEVSCYPILQQATVAAVFGLRFRTFTKYLRQGLKKAAPHKLGQCPVLEAGGEQGHSLNIASTLQESPASQQ